MSFSMDKKDNILIVDDKEVDVNGICYLIEKHKIPLSPLTALTGKKALKILREQRVSVLFTDVCMPNMDGHELIREARRLQPDLKVVIFSAHENFSYAHQAINLGVETYLVKPVAVETFLSCMNELCGQLEKERLEKAQSVYSDVITGRSIYENGAACGVSDQGYVFILDFLEPYFNLNHFSFPESQSDCTCLSVPVNEYHCAFIAETMAAAEKSMDYLLTKFHNAEKSFLLVDGGAFTSFSTLRSIFRLVENLRPSKLFPVRNTKVSLTEMTSNPGDVDADFFLTACGEAGKLILQKDYEQAISTIDEIFDRFMDCTFVPTDFAKFICTEIIRYELLSGADNDRSLLLKYVTEIGQSESIDDLKSICINLIRQSTAGHDEERMVIARAMDIIHSRYMDNISLESVGAEIHLSAGYLSYLFKKITGENFIKHLTTYRVETAKNLLRTTRLKIVSICERVGYSNVSYFCQVFKNHTGVTPAQYREEQTGIGE